MPVGTSAGGDIVCPYIASVDVASHLNVTSETKENVVITNIDETFLSSSANLAAAFDCSGWGIDMSLGEEELLISALQVSLSGSVLHGILAAAIGDDSEEATLNAYLRTQFTNAFALAFPDYVSLPNATDGTDIDSAADSSGGTPLNGTTAQNGTSAAQPSASGSTDTASALGPSVVQQTSTIHSFTFKLDVSGAVAAGNMVDNLTEAHLNSLFMQLPYVANIQAHVDASGNPDHRNLPLNAGDSITFVFDIEVATTSDDNTSSAAAGGNATGAPAANPATNSTVQQSINMDLGTRRVAFKISQV